MPEQPPAFVVVDKRKFTMDGELREAPASTQEEPSPKVVTMPARTPEAAQDATAGANDLRDEDMAGALEPTGTGEGLGFEPEEPALDGEPGLGDLAADDLTDDDLTGEPVSAAENAAQEAAYRQSSREIDAMLQQAEPGAQQPGTVGFDHVIQSFYLSAIMAMGAGTQQGQKPRIDILGARQAIDMLAVLEEKTRGNLSTEEQQLLQGITFELRMMFLELTNAISRQAQQAPPPSSLNPRGIR